MSPFLKRALPLLVVLTLLLPVGIYLATKKIPPPIPAKSESLHPALSVLGEKPDWSALEVFQNTITRPDFERLLTTVFTTGEVWRQFIEIDDTEARILTEEDTLFHLRFATSDHAAPVPRRWKTGAGLAPAPANQPLASLHIAIDPGHIGGEWSKIEERWFVVGNGSPVCEGDMTLQVAKLLKPRLEALGATVSLVREKPEPVTPLRPDSLVAHAAESAASPDSPAALQRLAERLFYRTAEIRARAKLVNESLKPDLVLCLHFNADGWGDPNAPTLVDRHHLHLLLNGAYNDEEVALADQRFAMLKKLLNHTHQEEALVGATVADTFAAASGLPPFIYPPDSPNALPVSGHPFLWARNLLANRLYDCPVIFMEPYVMNSTIDYPRIQAGDYDGLREINGKRQASIFREYADSLVEGLARHYSGQRGIVADADGHIQLTPEASWQLKPFADPVGGGKFATSAFIHPLRTPSGFECTTIRPPGHLHHLGIWWPWKFIEVDGAAHNCWEIQQGQGALVARSAHRLGPSEWELHNVIELRRPDSPPTPVIEETARIEFTAGDPSATTLDLSLRQTPTGKPVNIATHHYSGFTWRGPASWDATNSHLVTSERLGRDEANGKPARWVLFSGPSPGGSATVLLMSAASEIAGKPEHLRVWDSSQQNGAPFVNFNPVSEIPLPLDDAHPAVSNRRYRIIAADRLISPAEAETEWQAWIRK